MNELKFSHVDILVSNLEAARDYHRKVFGWKSSAMISWKRDDFHVDFVILKNNSSYTFLVKPYSGNLLTLLEKSGDGTIYRYCFLTDDLCSFYDHLIKVGVQPEDENGRCLERDHLNTPAGINAIWLPKKFGQLSVEVLDKSQFEAFIKKQVFE